MGWIEFKDKNGNGFTTRDVHYTLSNKKVSAGGEVISENEPEPVSKATYRFKKIKKHQVTNENL